MNTKETPENTKTKANIKQTPSVNANLSKPNETPAPTVSNETPKIAVKKSFHQYKSSRPSMRMLTTEGVKIIFTNFTCITKNPLIIAYLDAEIKLGLRDVVATEMLETDEKDPMAALKAKHFAEFKATQVREASDKALGITRDMGDNRPAGQPGIGALGTNKLAV